MEFHEEPGPAFNQKLPRYLVISGNLSQGCPCRGDLENAIESIGSRLPCAYEVAINHLLGMVETMKRIVSLTEGIAPGVNHRPIDAIWSEAKEALRRIGE